jgi:hypothetical protein
MTYRVDYYEMQARGQGKNIVEVLVASFLLLLLVILLLLFTLPLLHHHTLPPVHS